MNKVINFLLVAVMLFALPGCSDDDEPKNVDPSLLWGEWYLTNVKGWEYDEDHDKTEFNETFNFNGQGIPVGDNLYDAQKVRFSRASFDTEAGIVYIDITGYYWSMSNQDWLIDQQGSVQLKGNQLIDGTMKASIIRLTDDTMTTYQKDEDGETYITYTKL